MKKILYKEIYQNIKIKIINQVFKYNHKLSSIRQYSDQTGYSTTTIERAYEQLLVEGYIYSIPKSGYYVAKIDKLKPSISNQRVQKYTFKYYRNNQLTHDLFDIKQYKSIVNKVFNYEKDALYSELDTRGEEVLREEIKKYVLKERNIEADIDQIIIGPGIQYLLHILLSISYSKKVTYLKPSFEKAISIFESYNYKIIPCKNIREITKKETNFIYISPSNIYPSGEVLKIQDRTTILNYANDIGAYIIEDDYNFLFKYHTSVVPSIYSIDQNDRVVYMGSFSKTLLPSSRISFMILPPNLCSTFLKKIDLFSQGVSKLEQYSLAYFMKEGLFYRHTKKLLSLYKLKNETIIKELNLYKQKSQYELSSNDSNLHVVIHLKNKERFKKIVKKLESLELGYKSITGTNDILFPYSGLQIKEIPIIVNKIFS